jgi:hypothetical protein
MPSEAIMDTFREVMEAQKVRSTLSLIAEGTITLTL